jgi:hypothetical protein
VFIRFPAVQKTNYAATYINVYSNEERKISVLESWPETKVKSQTIDKLLCAPVKYGILKFMYIELDR